MYSPNTLTKISIRTKLSTYSSLLVMGVVLSVGISLYLAERYYLVQRAQQGNVEIVQTAPTVSYEVQIRGDQPPSPGEGGRGRAVEIVRIEQGNAVLEVHNPADLPHPGTPVPGGHPPESSVADHLEDVAGPEAGPGVALPTEGEDRIRAGLDPAVDHAREVNTQEWEPRVRDRVDQVPYQPPPLRHQIVILAAKRDDL